MRQVFSIRGTAGHGLCARSARHSVTGPGNRAATTNRPADTDIAVTLRISGPLSIIGPALADHAEAVVREAVTNTVRHSGTTALTVEITAADDLVLLIEDDGRGIPDDITASGLINLARRAEQANGHLTIEPAGDTEPPGTRLRWTAPLDQPAS